MMYTVQNYNECLLQLIRMMAIVDRKDYSCYKCYVYIDRCFIAYFVLMLCML